MSDNNQIDKVFELRANISQKVITLVDVGTIAS